MVYVLSKDGNPLAPTARYGKVRHLIQQGQACVIEKTPFTIQLTYDSPDRDFEGNELNIYHEHQLA